VPGAASSDQLSKRLAELYQDYFDPSPLMVAQYLKNGLGTDFVSYVRDALYVRNPTSSVVIDAIVDLCRPQRSRKSLNSIITFNFDDLIEKQLESNSIRHVSIFTEGQRPGTELPIYHVHGFLPRAQTLTLDHSVVFAEDAYHDQFIDPFSWSNLIQLNHLSQYLCLLVGLSVTDPNLRRLLDVSMRKNPDGSRNHYVFKKTYDVDEIKGDAQGIQGVNEQAIHDFVKSSELLEEQDANNFGLNVIWINDYAEIPGILRKIAEG